MKRRTFWGMATVAAATFLAHSAVLAQAPKFPTKEINILMPIGPGGGGDLATRPVASHMAKTLGVPVLIKHMPGAGGVLSVTTLANSPPDGHVIGIAGTFTMGALPHMMKVPFDRTSFESLGCWSTLLYGVGVAENSPIKSIDDLVALGKTRVVTFSGAHMSNGMAVNQLAAATGAKFRWIPSGSAGEAVAQAIGGHVDFTLQSYPDMTPQIEGKKMRILASASEVRWPNYPETKTLIEMGHNAANRNYMCLAAPKGTPPAVKERLERAVMDAADDPDTVQTLQKLGSYPYKMTSEQFNTFFKDEEKRLMQLVEEEKARNQKKS